MNIRPLHDRIVVRRVDAKTTSAGGIIIPDNAQEKPIQGEVVAVGGGAVLQNGDRRELDLQVGDRVLFGDTHVVEALRVLVGEFDQTRTLAHGRGDGMQ